MKKIGIVLAIVGLLGLSAYAGNYELLVRAIGKMTTDIRLQKIAIAEIKRDLADIQDTLGSFAERGGSAVKNGARIEERLRNLEIRMDANAKEVEDYWKKVIAQRRTVLEEAEHGTSIDDDRVRGAEAGVTPADRRDIEAIKSYLRGD